VFRCRGRTGCVSGKGNGQMNQGGAVGAFGNGEVTWLGWKREGSLFLNAYSSLSCSVFQPSSAITPIS